MTQITLPKQNQTGSNEWADVQDNDEAIANVVNGNLDNNNIAANAAISYSKLASISTGSILLGNGGTPTVAQVQGHASIGNDGTVTVSSVSDSAITTAKVNDSAITTAKINDGAITAAKITDGVLPYAKIKADAWTSYTPTIVGFGGTNPSLGNATVSAAYCQLGKTVQYRAKITFGSTTTFGAGAYILSTPVGVISGQQGAVIGTGHIYDSSATTTYPLTVFGNSLGATLNWGYTVSSKLTLNNLSATDPVTLASGDVLSVAVTYEAA